MTTSKGISTAAAAAAQPSSHECCMCGDFGFSYELFQCKVCQFRSQHRYCSNLYPNAESYRICNWCLTQKEDTKEKSQNSSNSSSSCKKEPQDTKKNKKLKNPKGSNDQKQEGPPPYGGLRASMKLQPSGPIKKQRSLDHHHHHHHHQAFLSPSPVPSPSSSTRKRIITNGAKESEKIRRTRSEEMSNTSTSTTNGIITRQLFRNKVRRYRLLDEVSSQ